MKSTKSEPKICCSSQQSGTGTQGRERSQVGRQVFLHPPLAIQGSIGIDMIKLLLLLFLLLLLLLIWSSCWHKHRIFYTPALQSSTIKIDNFFQFLMTEYFGVSQHSVLQKYAPGAQHCPGGYTIHKGFNFYIFFYRFFSYKKV